MSTEETGGTANHNAIHFKKQIGWAGNEKGAIDVVWGLLFPWRLYGRRFRYLSPSILAGVDFSSPNAASRFHGDRV